MMSGCVFAPCSGVRSQATFGFSATFLPALKNRSQPPIFAMPASIIFGMSVPCTTTTVAAGSAATAGTATATAAVAPAFRNVRLLIAAMSILLEEFQSGSEYTRSERNSIKSTSSPARLDRTFSRPITEWAMVLEE